MRQGPWGEMNGKKGGKAMAAMLLLSSSIVSIAAFSVGVASAQTLAEKAFSIPSGSLSQALTLFGRQAGLQVTYNPAIAAGKQTVGVRGNLTANEAVARILAGSGLNFSFPNASTIAVSEGQSGTTSAAGGVAADGSTILDTITVSGKGGMGADFDPASIYTTPNSNFNVNREMIDRIAPTSTGDIFKGVPGVQVGDKRNGVDFQPNVRGAQGHGRVKVIVDGTDTSTQKRATYGGTQERNYIDPDFLAGFSVTKGPDSERGSLGGTINMRTLNADDLITDPNKKWGLRVSGSMANNTSDSLESFGWCTRTTGVRGNACLAGGTYTDGSGNVFDDHRVFETGATIPSINASGSIMGAWRPYDPLELVLGYSHRSAGNYHAGEKGENPIVRTSGNLLGRYYNDGRPLQYYSLYQPGDEVYGTYYNTQSILAKTKIELPNDHILNFGYNHYTSDFSKAGFSYPSVPTSTDQYLKTIFAATSNVKQDRYSLGYEWNPDSDLWRVKADLFVARTKEVLWDYQGLDTETTDTLTSGLNVANTSAMTWLDREVTLKTGFSVRHDKLDFARNNGNYSDFYTIDIYDADRLQYGLFTNLDIALTDWMKIDSGIRYDRFDTQRHDRPTYTSAYSTLRDAEGDGFGSHIGVTLSPVEGTQFFARYSSGWRAPSVYELFARNCNGTKNGASCVEGEIRPEKMKNFEFGANFDFTGLLNESDRLGLKISRFDNRYSDYITGGGNSINPFSNRPSAHFSGVEIAANYDYGRFFADYTLTYFDKAKVCRRSGDYTLLGIPSSSGGLCYENASPTSSVNTQGKINHTLTVGMRAFDEKLTIGGRGNFVSGANIREETVFKAIEAFDDYQIFDLFAKYRHENFETSISVENLTDRYYFDAGTTPFLALPAPGRTVRFKLTKTF